MKSIISILLLCSTFAVKAQQQNHRSRSELGIMVGGSYYLGDLNQFRQFYKTNLAAGVVYRYNVHSRMSLRGNVMYGSVEAYDSDSKIELLKNRNLSFESNIFEIAGGVEFNYFPFQIGNQKHRGTAYILTEIGIFRMNPTTKYNDDKIELQPLGTEGQGSSLNSKGAYNLVQLCIPLGVGAKLSLGRRTAVSLELGIRKTFTDYLDDVGSDSYVDESILAEENGPLAAELSNRSLDGSRFGKRGTSATSDWYVFTGGMITFSLGNPNKCFDH